MNCDDITPLLDDYVNGTLPPAVRTEVAAHLAGCARCRAEVASLQQLVAEARALPRSVLPERDLWLGIEARLPAARRMGPDSTGRPVGGLYYPTPSRRPARLLLQLAAALALLLAGAALATWYQRGAQPRAFAVEQERYAQATAELARQLTAEPQGLSAATKAVVERNLSIVDQAIREAEAALRQDQGNPALEQMLVARYEQRLSLLRRATAAGRRES